MTTTSTKQRVTIIYTLFTIVVVLLVHKSHVLITVSISDLSLNVFYVYHRLLKKGQEGEMFKWAKHLRSMRKPQFIMKIYLTSVES